MGYLLEKLALREDYTPEEAAQWTRKPPRTYKEWSKFRPQNEMEWRGWEEWQLGVDHGDGDIFDKERWKVQKNFAETGESEAEWIERSRRERAEEEVRENEFARRRMRNLKIGLGAAATGTTLFGLANRKAGAKNKAAKPWNLADLNNRAKPKAQSFGPAPKDFADVINRAKKRRGFR